MANILLYLYCFSLPYQAITIGGIAIVKITGLLLSGWLALELGFRRFHKSDLFVVLLVSMAPLYLLVMEAIRTSAGYAINFYTPFISNVLLFILMILSSHSLNLRRGLTVFVISSFIIPIVMFSPYGDIGEYGRRSALGLNPNTSAIFLSLSFLYIAIAAKQQKRIYISLIMYLFSLVPLLGVISTGTRFGILICGFFICIFLYKKIALRFGKIIATFMTGIITTVGIFLFIGSDLVVVTRFLELGETFTTQGRLVLWALAIESVGGNYLFGIGPDAFTSFIVPIMGSYMSPHNVFFEFYIYGGLIGALLSFNILYLAISGLTIKSNIRGNEVVYFCSVILLAIILLVPIVFNKFFWFLLAYVYRSSYELKLSHENNYSN